MNRTPAPVLAVALAVALTVACSESKSPSADAGSPSECLSGSTVDVGLRAYAAPRLDQPELRIFGSTDAPPGVAVQAIFVAGVEVPRTTFNFRGWSVDVSGDRIRALAGNADRAEVQITAFTSAGCTSLQPPLTVLLPIDAGPPDTASSPADAGGSSD